MATRPGRMEEYEFACPCRTCSGFPKDRARVRELVERAEWLQTELFPRYRLLIVRAYLCPHALSGVVEQGKEAHAECRGFDFVLQDVSPATVQKMLAPLVREGHVAWVGRFSGYTHVEWSL